MIKTILTVAAIATALSLQGAGLGSVRIRQVQTDLSGKLTEPTGKTFFAANAKELNAVVAKPKSLQDVNLTGVTRFNGGYDEFSTNGAYIFGGLSTDSGGIYVDGPVMGYGDAHIYGCLAVDALWGTGTNVLNGACLVGGVPIQKGQISGTNLIPGTLSWEMFDLSTSARIQQALPVQVKPPFSQSYEVLLEDRLLLCNGTNQIIVLPDARYTILGARLTIYTTTKTGSVLVVPQDGQTVRGEPGLDVPPVQHVELVSDGSNWW